MADYGDTSGGYSDQAIRDIVAQLQNQPQQPAPGAAGVMPAPQVTPTMLQGTGVAQQPAGPGLPMNLVPPQAAPAKTDDWTPPPVVMTPPPVTAVPVGSPMGMLAAAPRPVMPMGSAMARR